MSKCVFCDIRDGKEPATFLQPKWWSDVMVFEPLNPVVPGHLLVVPKKHVADFTENSEVSGLTMRYAASFARDLGVPMNMITSKGQEATQSVFHMHLHLVPRSSNDGLALPWYSGKSKNV